jgi:hypothetical protein
MAKEKVTRDPNDPLSIWREMSGLDRKDYAYFDRLDESQQKTFSPFILLKWGASIEGNDDLAKYYIVAANQFANQGFWDLNRHKKLQWLTLCTISPGMGNARHYWLGAGKKDAVDPIKKLLMELLPNTKPSDIDLILQVNTREDLLEWLENHGIQKEVLKKLK